MTRIIIKVLLFDQYNLEHISRHQVTQAEASEAALSLVYHKRSYNKRYIVIGRSKLKIITLVLNRKGIGVYYLITARDASKKERKLTYEKENKKQNS